MDLAGSACYACATTKGTEMYSIATVTDDTNTSLDYGDYRGLVVLDHDGVCVGQVDSMTAAQTLVATELGINPDDVNLEDVPAGQFYGNYGRCWNAVGPYAEKETTYTAWLTTDRSCLATDMCDVVVLANDWTGASTGDPLWSAATTVPYTQDEARDEDLIRQAKELLADAGWHTEGDVENVGTGYIVNVTRA